MTTLAGPASTDRRARGRDIRVAVLVLLTGAVVVVPRTIQTFSSPKYRIAVGADPTPYVPLAAHCVTLLTYTLIAFCLLIIIEVVGDPPPGRVGLLVLALVPWTYLVLRDLSDAIKPTSMVYLYPLLTIAVWVLRPRMAQLRYLGYVVVVAVVLSLVLGWLMPASAIFRSAAGDSISEDKQILPWGLLVGIFTQGNNLGQFLVLGLPGVALIRSRRWRAIAFLLLGFTLVWSASRGSLLASGMVIVAAGLLLLTPAALRRAVGLLVGIVPFLVVVAVPLSTTDPLAFTNRGYIWQVSLLAWQRDDWFGRDAHFFQDIGGTSATLGPTVYHGHNQLVQLLTTGGLLLAIAVAAVMLAAVSSAVRLFQRGHILGLLWLVGFAGTCILEVSLVLVDNGFLLPVMVLPLAFILFSADHDVDPGGAGVVVPADRRAGISDDLELMSA